MHYSEPKLANVEIIGGNKLRIDGKKAASVENTTRLQLLYNDLPIGTVDLPIGTVDQQEHVQLGDELTHRWFAPADDPFKQRSTKEGK